MTVPVARAVIKSIRRHLWKIDRSAPPWGWDYATWSVVYPQTARVMNEAAQTITGHPGRYVPRLR